MVYVISCKDSQILKDEVMKMVKDKVHVLDDFNFASYDMYNQLIQDGIEACYSISFNSEFKEVIFYNCYFLSNQAKANNNWTNKMDFSSLDEYLKNQNPDCDLYLTTSGELSSETSNQLIKLLKQSAKFIIINPKTENELIDLGTAYLGKQGISISKDALLEIIKRVDSNYTLMLNTLDKLACYTDKIRIEDVEVLVCNKLEDSAFSIVNNLFSFSIKDALKSYRDLISKGNNTLILFSTIASQFTKLFMVCKLLENRVSDDKIAKMLHYRSIYYVKKSIGNFTSYDILNMMKDLHEIEINIKFNLDNPINAIELFILNFKTNYLR